MDRLPAKVATIRQSLIGALTDFVQEADFVSNLNLVVELAYELAAYREEDVAFFPSVYVVQEKDDADTLSVIAPAADRIRLKNEASRSISASAILKDCAALAQDGWSVFIDVTGGSITYGLFRSEMLPSSVSSSDFMADPSEEAGSALLLRNCSKNCVEILASNGQRLELGLTSQKPGSVSISDSYELLVENITAELAGEQTENVKKYLSRVISNACQQCHGTIIAVVQLIDNKLPSSFSDGVALEEPIDIVAGFLELVKEGSAKSLERLRSREAILRGMIQSDGITVFSTNGRLMAFRVFIQPNAEESRRLDGSDARGGARSRAFELLKMRTNSSVVCGLFQSQDGKTECVIKS